MLSSSAVNFHQEWMNSSAHICQHWYVKEADFEPKSSSLCNATLNILPHTKYTLSDMGHLNERLICNYYYCFFHKVCKYNNKTYSIWTPKSNSQRLVSVCFFLWLCARSVFYTDINVFQITYTPFHKKGMCIWSAEKFPSSLQFSSMRHHILCHTFHKCPPFWFFLPGINRRQSHVQLYQVDFNAKCADYFSIIFCVNVPDRTYCQQIRQTHWHEPAIKTTGVRGISMT